MQWFLLLLAIAALALAGLRTYDLILYNRRRQRRGREKPARKPDRITLGLYAGGAAALLLAILLFALGGGTDAPPAGSTTDSTTDTTGAAVTTGWMESSDGRRYYLLEDGSFVTGWMEEGTRIYYMDDSGMTLRGWNEVEGITRYFRDDGSMARGEEVIDGVTCHFTATGAQVLLVNASNPVPADYQVELTNLSVVYAINGVQVSSNIYDALISMMDACNAASGSRCCVINGYRAPEIDEETQTLLPSYSEYQLGLAVDIVDTQSWAMSAEQANLPAQKWLMEHCYEYGFILRYPAGKTEFTGMDFAPWHYRYVGTELALELKNSGLSLEEYLNALD